MAKGNYPNPNIECEIISSVFTESSNNIENSVNECYESGVPYIRMYTSGCGMPEISVGDKIPGAPRADNMNLTWAQIIETVNTNDQQVRDILGEIAFNKLSEDSTFTDNFDQRTAKFKIYVNNNAALPGLGREALSDQICIDVTFNKDDGTPEERTVCDNTKFISSSMQALIANQMLEKRIREILGLTIYELQSPRSKNLPINGIPGLEALAECLGISLPTNEEIAIFRKDYKLAPLGGDKNTNFPAAALLAKVKASLREKIKYSSFDEPIFKVYSAVACVEPTDNTKAGITNNPDIDVTIFTGSDKYSNNPWINSNEYYDYIRKKQGTQGGGDF